MAGGVVQFPVYFMDDVWLLTVAPGELAAIDVQRLLAPDGWKVFDFHPPHIYYNTPSIDYYQQHKEAYFNKPKKSIRWDGRGIRDIFIEILDELEYAQPLGDCTEYVSHLTE